MTKALTASAIKQAKPGSNTREIPDGGMRGLYLVIYPSGKKGWAVRYRRKSDGKPRKLTLGTLHVPDDPKAKPRESVAIGDPLSLAEAHRLAGEMLHRVALGHDPAAEKQIAKKAAKRGDASDRDMFANVVADFLKRHARKNRSAAETSRLFAKEVLPAWGKRRVAEITKRDVIELLDAIADSGRGTTAKPRARGDPQAVQLVPWARRAFRIAMRGREAAGR